jgi:molybdopterin molybdotransferase
VLKRQKDPRNFNRKRGYITPKSTRKAIGEELERRVDRVQTLKLLPYSEMRERLSLELKRIMRIKGSDAFETITVDLGLGRVSAETVYAQKDVPSTDISAMDGYAVQSVCTKRASHARPVSLKLKGSIFVASSLRDSFQIASDETYYVATGSSLPRNADAVARVEKTILTDEGIRILREIPRGMDIEPRGKDMRNGQVVLNSGTLISPSDIALLISAGVKRIRVNKLLKLGVLSIGDELRPFSPHEKELEEQESRTVVNDYSNLIMGYLKDLGIEGFNLGVSPDDADILRNKVSSSIFKLDALIAIGGSSVGRKDLTVSSLFASGPPARLIFHGLRVVPLKPVGVGLLGEIKPVIILPAHSISAALSFFIVAVPVLNLLSGLDFDSRMLVLNAVSTTPFSNEKPIESVRLIELREPNKEGEELFSAIALPWSSNLTSVLARASGFIILKPKQSISTGERIHVKLLGNYAASKIRCSDCFSS